MKRKSLLFACLLLLALPFYAAQVDTVMVQSPSMNKEVQVVVVTPDVALGKKAVACPVVYLLHGFGGNAKTWINTKPELPQIADEKGIIFVCPDGKNTWYWDSPKNKDVRYETFISSELIKYIDGHYKTVAAPRGRAITGLRWTRCTLECNPPYGCIWCCRKYQWRSGYSSFSKELDDARTIG